MISWPFLIRESKSLTDSESSLLVRLRTTAFLLILVETTKVKREFSNWDCLQITKLKRGKERRFPLFKTKGIWFPGRRNFLDNTQIINY